MSKKYTPTPGNNWEYGEKVNNDWHVFKGPCPSCGERTYDYGGGWRCVRWYCQNSAGNLVGNLGPDPEWWLTTVNVIKDGNQWCAFHDGFINLQESNAAFADTPGEAVKLLLASDAATI